MLRRIRRAGLSSDDGDIGGHFICALQIQVGSPYFQIFIVALTVLVDRTVRGHLYDLVKEFILKRFLKDQVQVVCRYVMPFLRQTVWI